MCALIFSEKILCILIITDAQWESLQSGYFTFIL